MSSPAPDSASTKVKEVLDSGQARFDLSRPPSRAEAGMPDGKTDVTYQRADHTPFQVRVALPGGKELSTEARLVTFDSLAQPDPRNAAPSALDIHYYAPSLEAGRDHLLGVASQFGFDTKPINEWYDESKAQRPTQAPPDVRTPWLTTTLGYLTFEVQGGYEPPVDRPESDQTVVHYALAWGPGPRPGTT